MSDTKHTPTPWIAEGSYWIMPAAHRDMPIGASTNAQEHVSKFAHVIAKVEQDTKRFTNEQVEANADFIVRAVNSHEQLVAVLREAEGVIAEVCVDQHPDNVCCHVLRQVRAALAEVEA
jgi:hypothetical protein